MAADAAAAAVVVEATAAAAAITGSLLLPFSADLRLIPFLVSNRSEL